MFQWIFKPQILWSQFLWWEDSLLFFLLYHYKLNVFVFLIVSKRLFFFHPQLFDNSFSSTKICAILFCVSTNLVISGASLHAAHLGGSTSTERRWKSPLTAWSTHTDMSWTQRRRTSTCSWRRSVNTPPGGFNHEIIPHRLVLTITPNHCVTMGFVPILQDSFGRYLKSPVFKDTLKKAVCPEEHKYS